MQRTWVQSLMKELRSHILSSTAKNYFLKKYLFAKILTEYSDHLGFSLASL